MDLVHIGLVLRDEHQVVELFDNEVKNLVEDPLVAQDLVLVSLSLNEIVHYEVAIQKNCRHWFLLLFFQPVVADCSNASPHLLFVPVEVSAHPVHSEPPREQKVEEEVVSKNI